VAPLVTAPDDTNLSDATASSYDPQQVGLSSYGFYKYMYVRKGNNMCGRQ